MNDILLYEDISEIEQGFPIKIRKYNAAEFSPHWHEHIELLHILSGSGSFFCNSNRFEAREGETIIVNSNELHSMQSDKSVEYICAIINPSIFNDTECKNIILESKIAEDELITAAFGRILEKATHAGSCSDMIIKGEIYLLMAYLIENYTAMQLSEFEYETRIGRMKKINMLLDYIHENYNQPISTSNLAKMYYVTESHLCRIFKQSVGMTILEYINCFRIGKAAILLKNTDESISDIAQSVGYDNLNYFDRLFKRYKHMPPKEYRERNFLCKSF